MYDNLEQSPVFMGIAAVEIEKILDSVHHQVRKYPEGHLLAQGGETCDRLMILLRGCVRGEMVDFSGKTLKIEDIESPRPLAIAFLFGTQNRFPVNIMTNCECEILILPRESVIAIIQRSRKFLENYLNAISSRTQFLTGKIRFLSFKTIREKIAHYILDLAGPDKRIITLPESQQQLSDFFGVTRPSFSRALGEMETEGLIRVERRRTIIIEDRIRLNSLIQVF
ncbi:MAG: Crp/Fnr family transcriptional regulator [Bacteroidota bacterium]